MTNVKEIDHTNFKIIHNLSLIIFDPSVSVPVFKIKFLIGIFKCLHRWCILYIIR